jgi:hypothetical protein
VEKPKGKRNPGKPERRWKINIKLNLRRIGSEDLNWTQMALDKIRWRL